MRRISNVLPMILLAASLPAVAIQADPPNPGSSHRIQFFRTGTGEARTRDAGTARKATPRPPSQAQQAGRTRPYQVAKPGEGEPKAETEGPSGGGPQERRAGWRTGTMLHLPPLDPIADATRPGSLSGQFRRVGAAAFPLVQFRGKPLDVQAQ